MREKARPDELAFALTADVSEAHRQVPIHPDDWHLLGCQVIPRRSIHQHGWNIWHCIGVLLLVSSRSGGWSIGTVLGRRDRYRVAYVGRRRLSS